MNFGVRSFKRPQLSGATSGANAIEQAPAPAASNDWSFVNGGSNSNTGASWKTPGSKFQTFPKGHRTTYTIKFNTDCPQNPVHIIFATTGYSFVFLNGQLIHSWGDPYPEYHNVTLQKPHLVCGCNTIEVIVYNYCCPSPCGLTYSLTQDKTGCYQCDNLGLTYYNRTTCECKCSENMGCQNALKVWSDYPSCGCKCKAQKKCPSGQYFSWQTCNCHCK